MSTIWNPCRICEKEVSLSKQEDQVTHQSINYRNQPSYSSIHRIHEGCLPQYLENLKKHGGVCSYCPGNYKVSSINGKRVNFEERVVSKDKW